MSLETVSEVRAHGGIQGVYRRQGAQTLTPMSFMAAHLHWHAERLQAG